MIDFDWTDKKDGVDDILAEDINKIATGIKSVIEEISRMKNSIYQGEISSINGIMSDNKWKKGWYWYVGDGGGSGNIAWYAGEVLLAVKDHPDEPIAEKDFYNYFKLIGREFISDISKLNEKVSSCLKLGYTWYIDTDIVRDVSGKSCGSLKTCMTDGYAGTWFYVRTVSSEAGSAAYPSTYTIDGANGYLSLRDYVVWTGSRLVHIPAYEAKASTQKNSDGQYSPKSGVDGLMSSTDKAYLTDLANRFIASNQKSAHNSGNDCAESGLYGHVNAGRPTGSELFNLISVKDKNNNSTSQLAIGQDSGELWARGKVSGSWIKFLTEEFFNASWGKRYMPVFHCKDTDSPDGWMVNWCRDTGVYIGGIKKDCGGHPPVLNNNHTSWVIAVYSGIKTENGASDYNHRMQIAYDTVNAIAYIRRGWISTNEWAGWVKVGKIADGSIVTSMLSNLCVTESKIATGAVTTGKYANKSITMAKLSEELQTLLNGHTNQIGSLSDLNTASKENVVAAVNEVKAEAGTAVKIRGSLDAYGYTASDDPDYNGYNIHTLPKVEKGDAYVVSKDLTTILWGKMKPKAGDMIISIGDNPSYESNWLILPGAEAMSALESRLAAIERQLNGISFDVDANGNLTYEKQEEVIE